MPPPHTGSSCRAGADRTLAQIQVLVFPRRSIPIRARQVVPRASSCRQHGNPDRPVPSRRLPARGRAAGLPSPATRYSTRSKLLDDLDADHLDLAALSILGASAPQAAPPLSLKTCLSMFNAKLTGVEPSISLVNNFTCVCPMSHEPASGERGVVERPPWKSGTAAHGRAHHAAAAVHPW